MYIVFNVFVNKKQDFDHLTSVNCFLICGFFVCFACTLSVVFFFKILFLKNVRIINQLTNLQTTVLRVFILSLFVLNL